MKVRFRNAALLLIASALAVLATVSASADTWIRILEGSWYKSQVTCFSRAMSLIETGQYSGPVSCIRNTYASTDGTVRYSLWIYKNVDGSGGGGIGSWAVHESA